MTTHFGDRLRRLRLEKGWSQQQAVAHIQDNCPEMNVSQTTISALEKRSTLPRGEVVNQLANAFSVSIEYFYSDLGLEAVEGEDLTRLAARLSAIYREFKPMMTPEIQAQFRALIAVVTEKSLE